MRKLLSYIIEISCCCCCFCLLVLVLVFLLPLKNPMNSGLGRVLGASTRCRLDAKNQNRASTLDRGLDPGAPVGPDAPSAG